MAGGGYTFCDPTVENSPDLLLCFEGDASMLVCTEQGDDLTTSPHSPASENMGTFDARSRVDDRGKLTSEVNLTTRGIYDIAFRQWCKSMPPQQREVFWQRVVSGIHPGARLTGFSASDPEDLYTPFSLSFSYEVEDYAIEAGKYLLIKSPISTNRFELMLSGFLAGASLPTRKYAFDFGITLGSTQAETLLLPAGYRVKSTPETVDIESGELGYRMAYQASEPNETDPGLRVDYTKRFLIDSKKLDPERYLELKRILLTSSTSGRGEIILERTGKTGPKATF
ncbi:MAG: hypothetical protein U9P14_01360 [Gemmatimonadota bacterium]|nr:hypothetical protein [Gemmatimonadota bacterium]